MSFQISNARLAFFASREEYLQYKASWKARAARKELTSRDCFLHTLLLGKDLYRAFSPSKKAVRGGATPYIKLANLLYSEVLYASRTSRHGELPTHIAALHIHLAEHKKRIAEGLSLVANGQATDLLQLTEKAA
jgi:hypothetical protein